MQNLVKHDFSERTHLSVPYIICVIPYCATQIIYGTDKSVPYGWGNGYCATQIIYGTDKSVPYGWGNG